MNDVKNAPGLAEPRWARLKEICDHYRFSPATWWRWNAEREGCPKPRKHGPRVTVWDLNEIDAWLDAQQPSTEGGCHE